MPRVSVIIIIFNAKRFLAEAIESVCAQTYQDWELLLVDDGSSDGSSDIARHYCARYLGKMQYLQHAGHQNRGMSASRNLGMQRANGEYIAFLDADDVWLANKLTEQVAILDERPEAGMVLSAVQWWYSWTANPEDRGRDFVAALDVPSGTLVTPPAMLVALLRRATVSTTCSMIRRDVVHRVGGFEEQFTGMFEDQAFAAKLYLSVPVFIAPGWHYRWRKHAESSCAVAVSTNRYESARLWFLNWLKNYVSEKNIRDRKLFHVLQIERWKCRHPKFSQWSKLVEREHALAIESLKDLLRRTLPVNVQQRLSVWRHGREYSPAVGTVRFGHLNRLTPVSALWGFDRGLPVDRYYIERFLSTYAADIRGRVLEIADDNYTRKFGGDRVDRSDVLHPTDDNPRATIVADLTRPEQVPADVFDCIICTQTLMLIYETDRAMHTLYRALKPGGVLLLTLAGITPHRQDMERWGDYWRFTKLSARRLCETVFPPESIAVATYGNVLAATAFLHGLAREELDSKQLDNKDPDYEVLITVRAVKPRMSA